MNFLQYLTLECIFFFFFKSKIYWFQNLVTYNIFHQIMSLKILILIFFIENKVHTHSYNPLLNRYTSLKVQFYYVNNSNCISVLWITLYIQSITHIWVQTIKKLLQLSCSFQLHFIICRNYACVIQFGIAHYAFTPHLSSL
jgi:hypothetical protein